MEGKRITFRLPDRLMDFHALEDWIEEQRKLIAISLMQEVIKRLDEKIFEEKPPNWVSLGLRERTIETINGTLTYQRHVYRDRESGALYIPVDECLGWEPGAQVTPEVKRLYEKLAIKLPSKGSTEEILNPK